MNNKIKIEDISTDKNYIGYLWVSDNPQPKEYLCPTNLKDELSKFSNTKNPFIVEGQLCDENKEVSYSIKYVDGEYIVILYDLRNDSKVGIVYDEKRYIPKRLHVSKILFRQYWKLEKEGTSNVDESLCLGMPVLVPGPLVFVEFENN